MPGTPVDRLELQTSSRFLLTVNETVSNEILPDLSFRKRADSLRSLMALHQLHTMNPKQAKIKGSLNKILCGDLVHVARGTKRRGQKGSARIIFRRVARVLLGSIATETGLWGDVRFTPGSDRITDIPDRQLRARSGHSVK